MKTWQSTIFAFLFFWLGLSIGAIYFTYQIGHLHAERSQLKREVATLQITSQIKEKTYAQKSPLKSVSKKVSQDAISPSHK